MTDSCGNPEDTGQQLMAANIGYDNTLSNLAAAHVQAALDILATGTGLNQHPNLEGRELDDQHPQSAITGLIDALAGKATTSHRQAASTIDYDNSIVNILGAGTSQQALDELALLNQVGVIEYGATAIEVTPGEGIAASVNQMDWTGHPHADTVVTTALAIHTNHIVSFGNGTQNIWAWFGDKPQLVGVGSGYTATEADFQITGTGDHNTLTNRGLADAHPQSSVTDLVEDLALKLEDAPSDGTEYVRKDAAWINPSAVREVFTGFKNIVRNPRSLINQRGFDGNWSVAAMWGYDSWFKYDATDKGQMLEDDDLINGETYTLSWAGAEGDGTISHAGGSTSGPSPLTVTGLVVGVDNGTRVQVPHNATNVQLERGGEHTNFEVRPASLELSLVQRYYLRLFPNVETFRSSTFADGAYARWPIAYPVTMRAQPTTSGTLVELTNSRNAAIGSSNAAGAFVESRGTGTYSLQAVTVQNFTADAEITPITFTG